MAQRWCESRWGLHGRHRMLIFAVLQATGGVLLAGCGIAALATVTHSRHGVQLEQLGSLGSAAALATMLMALAAFALRRANAFRTTQVGCMRCFLQRAVAI